MPGVSSPAAMIDDLFMHLHEKWAAIAFRQRNRERTRLDRSPSLMP
jgi:hypothetical protein